MHEYMTRHMVARKEFTYAGQELCPGGDFLATPIDADYLKRCGRADDFVPPPPPPTATAAAAEEPIRRRGRRAAEPAQSIEQRLEQRPAPEGDSSPGEPDQPAD